MTQTLSYVVFGLFALLGVWLAITSGPIWWVAVVMFAAAPGLQYWQSEKIRRRATLYGVTAQ